MRTEMLDAIFALHGTCVVAAANTDASSEVQVFKYVGNSLLCNP
jgi:hypothetical protein